MAKRIALLGGTFDPIHFGHLVSARAVAELCDFPRVTLVPAAVPPHKDVACASGEDRLAMLELAIKDDPLFDICRIELDRRGPSYTYDTILELRERASCPLDISWIIGADMLSGLASWYRVAELLETVQIVVMSRPLSGSMSKELPTHGKKELLAELPVSVSDHMLDTPLIDISSRQIRQRVAAGLSVRYLTPDSVVGYISDHGLYRQAKR